MQIRLNSSVVFPLSNLDESSRVFTQFPYFYLLDMGCNLFCDFWVYVTLFTLFFFLLTIVCRQLLQSLTTFYNYLNP